MGAGMWYPPPPPPVRTEAMTGVTGADGMVTFVFDQPFVGEPVVQPAVFSTGELLAAAVVSVTVDEAVVAVRRPAGVLEVLGLSVLGGDIPAADVMVQITAQETPIDGEESP